MKVIIEKRFLRKFRKIDEEWRLRIFDVLKKLENGDLARLDIKKLKGYKNIYRIRVETLELNLRKKRASLKYSMSRGEKRHIGRLL